MTKYLEEAEILENKEINEWEKLIRIIENYIKRVKTLPEFYTILQSVHTTESVGNEQILSFLRTSKIGYLKIYQRILEEGLENFAGCAVIISHDRWFLDRICTHILAFEGNSEVYFFEGGFSDYEENKKKRLGADATPKRIKYRKLIRN
mgnify:CR=1 FL=1